MQVSYKWLVRDRDRHGNVRIYFRRNGRKIRLREIPGSAEFAARYDELARMFDTGAFAAARAADAAPGTLAWLARCYQAAAAFRDLDASTQTTRRRVIEAMLCEPIHPGAVETYGAFPIGRITLAALEVLRDRKRDLPGAATDRVKALRALFKWAAAEKIRRPNPALDLSKPRVLSDGHHTWTIDEVDLFVARHPLGTKAHLALTLMLYTGARRSDAVRLGRQHRRGGEMKWTAYKNRNRFPVTIDVPVLPPLAAALDAWPGGDLVYLVTEYGKPFSAAGFSNWFRDRCREAGLDHCSAHGLRKAGSTRAAEAGATAHQLMAMFGWRSLSEAERYTRAAERKVMAKAGAQALLLGMHAHKAAAKNVPPAHSRRRGGTNRQKN